MYDGQSPLTLPSEPSVVWRGRYLPYHTDSVAAACEACSTQLETISRVFFMSSLELGYCVWMDVLDALLPPSVGFGGEQSLGGKQRWKVSRKT